MLLNRARMALRRLGVDATRFPAEHPPYRVVQLLRSHQINFVVDVGANAGQYATELRGLGYADRILSCEPLLDAYETLQDRAGADALWQSLRTAVGDRVGEANLHVAGNRGLLSFLWVGLGCCWARSCWSAGGWAAWRWGDGLATRRGCAQRGVVALERRVSVAS
jgi:hypothetical protein